MASGPPKEPSFKINDRRSVSDGGASAAGASEAAQAAGANELDGPPSTPATAAPDPEYGPGALPPVDFHTFVLSLGSSALLHLGELEHPEAGAPQKDLSLAKHTIDMLAMLEQKTKGNLTPAEEKLIESLLYDLRLRYVEASKSPS